MLNIPKEELLLVPEAVAYDRWQLLQSEPLLLFYSIPYRGTETAQIEPEDTISVHSSVQC